MHIRSVLCSLFVLASIATVSAQAGEIRVYALGHDKATLAINRAKPKLFRPGQSPAPGLRLIAATSRYALMDVNGSKVRLSLGEKANFRASQ